MIANGKRQYYAAVKKLFALFKVIAPKHDGDFYCLNYFHSYSTRDSKNTKLYVKTKHSLIALMMENIRKAFA